LDLTFFVVIVQEESFYKHKHSIFIYTSSTAVTAKEDNNKINKNYISEERLIKDV